MRLQEDLASRVEAGPALDLSGVRHVAGADVSTQGERAYATVAVLSFPELSVVEVRGAEAVLEFPYVPGLLGMGLASHLGLFLDVPSVGCAKSRLVGEFEEPGREKGGVSDLVDRGEVVGKVVRTRSGVSPVFVSVGNRTDLDSAVELVLACCTRYRLPETTRQAHNAANRLRRGEDPEQALL